MTEWLPWIRELGSLGLLAILMLKYLPRALNAISEECRVALQAMATSHERQTTELVGAFERDRTRTLGEVQRMWDQLAENTEATQLVAERTRGCPGRAP